jgi:GT2 family glycosyltransferase
MIFTPNWLEALIEISKNYIPVACVGSSAIIGEHVLGWDESLRNSVAGSLIERHNNPGNFEPRIYPVEALEKVGLFDEVYGQQECEDVDLNYRLHMSGYKVLGTRFSVVYHAYALTRLALPEANHHLRVNPDIFRKKFPGVDMQDFNTFVRLKKSVCGQDVLFNTVI